MKKSDLVTAMSQRADLTRPQAEKAFNVFRDSITSALTSVGSSVSVTGFGSFVVKQRAPRKGRNPLTGEMFDIPSKPAVIFRPSEKLKKNLK